MTREPARSRILVIAGLILAAAQCAIYVWARSLPPQSPWGYLPLLCLLVTLGVAVVAGVTKAGKIFVAPLSRPARFEVRMGTFQLEPLLSPRFGMLVQLSFFGWLFGQMISQWSEPRDPDPVGAIVLDGLSILLTVVTAIGTSFVVVMAVMNWKPRPMFELTPGGIRSQTLVAPWFIPWEALYTGGPFRPRADALGASQLPLAVARPDLVERKRLARFMSRERPALSLAFNAHPWLLADAIRWYAEHPQHRAGIGTQEEHDRLIAAVTGDYPRLDVVRPPRPGLVTAAVWVAVAGACAGILLAGVNLYIAVSFQERIAEAALAVEGEESFFTSSPVLAAIWFGLTLVGVLLTLLAARGVWRGSQQARVGLLVLSGLVVLSGCLGSCFGSPSLSLLELPGEEPLGMLVVTVWMAHQSLAFAAGIAVLVLLVLPAASDYFKPRYLADPAVVKV